MVIALELHVWCDTCPRNTLGRPGESLDAVIARLTALHWTFAPGNGEPDGFVQCPQCNIAIAQQLAASRGATSTTPGGEET